MRTHRAGNVEIDQTRLDKDLDTSRSLTWSAAYSDYLFGGLWKNCVLFAPGGHVGDGVVTSYDASQPAAATENGEQLPYVMELIDRTVLTDSLNFVRLVSVADSVIIPHRDLLELDDIPEDSRNAHRMHMPLATHDQCFFSEAGRVYRMRRGEIWFLDASKLHSVAAFTQTPRIHLMLDFTDGVSYPLPYQPPENPEIPADALVTRPPLTEQKRDALLSLADVASMDNLAEVFSIVIKHHFRYDGGPDFAWKMMFDIAKASPDAQLPTEIERRHRHYTLTRSQGELVNA